MNIEILIYETFKDVPINGNIHFKKLCAKRFNIKDVNYSNIYAKIVNHQIAKYGSVLRQETGLDMDDYQINNRRASQRAYYDRTERFR